MSIDAITPAALAAGQMTQAQRAAQAPAPVLGSSFTELLTQGIERANASQLEADRQVEQMVHTQGANIHEAMLALSRADVTLRLTVRAGSKLVQAYQEISRMQI